MVLHIVIHIILGILLETVVRNQKSEVS